MKMTKIVINRQLVPMKAHYFLWNAGTGPVVPFLTTYARQLGFSSFIVGVIYTILPISGMVAKPLFGAIADRFLCQKKIFLASQLLTAAAFLSIFYAPQVPVVRKVHFSCFDGEAAFNTYQGSFVGECAIAEMQRKEMVDSCKMNCVADTNLWDTVCHEWIHEWNGAMSQFCNTSKQISSFIFKSQVLQSHSLFMNATAIFKVGNITLLDGSVVYPRCIKRSISTSCDIECDDYNLNDLISKAAIPDSEVYLLYQFWVFLMLMICGWVGQALAVSIGDAICFELLGDKPNRYGYQRSFGALGWGIFSALAGVIIDAQSKGQSQKNYLVAFYMAAAFLILDFIVSYRIEHSQRKVSSNIFRDVGSLLVDARIVVYLLWCVCVGMCTGLIWQFLFWLIEDLLKERGCDSQNWVKTLQGLIMMIQCLLGELPFFFLSGKILKKLGHITTMSLVLLVLGGRLILLSLINNPWWFLPVELSNGLTFGLFFACMASYASIVAPPGTEATMQGLVGAVFEGIGVSMGSLVAGLSYKKYGGPATFRYFGIGSLVACLIHVAVQYLIKQKDLEAKYAPPDDAMAKVQHEDQRELTIVDSQNL